MVSLEAKAAALEPMDEELAPLDRAQHAGDDQAEVVRIDARQLGLKLPLQLANAPGKHLDVARPSAARAVSPNRRALGRAPAPASLPPHLSRVHQGSR